MLALGELWLHIQNLLYQFSDKLRLERQLTVDKLVSDDTDGPRIHQLVIFLALKHLRCLILDSSGDGPHLFFHLLLLVIDKLAYTKVYKL
jgi:hypothetical protein